MIDNFDQLLKKLPRQEIHAPTNTFAHIFRHDYKENFISDWLAFLFNPEFSKSNEPLAALLRLALGSEPETITDVTIFREHTFDDNRRIDFYIETKEFIIGIENKIWSGLQPNQLQDYEKQLVSHLPQEKELVLILLCPSSNKLCADVQLSLGKFKLVTYEKLVEEFKKIRWNLFENLRITVLMEDFITHTEEYIMQDTVKLEETFEMWNFEVCHQDEINELIQKVEASKKQFGTYIEENFALITPCDEDWTTSIHATSKDPYFQLYKTNWRNAQVHFELLKKNQFPPTELQLVLHTREKGRTGKTEELYNLQDLVEKYLIEKYGNSSFPIRYDNKASFDESMATIFNALSELIEVFSAKIDQGIICVDQ